MSQHSESQDKNSQSSSQKSEESKEDSESSEENQSQESQKESLKNKSENKQKKQKQQNKQNKQQTQKQPEKKSQSQNGSLSKSRNENESESQSESENQKSSINSFKKISVDRDKFEDDYKKSQKQLSTKEDQLQTNLNGSLNQINQTNKIEQSDQNIVQTEALSTEQSAMKMAIDLHKRVNQKNLEKQILMIQLKKINDQLSLLKNFEEKVTHLTKSASTKSTMNRSSVIDKQKDFLIKIKQKHAKREQQRQQIRKQRQYQQKQLQKQEKRQLIVNRLNELERNKQARQKNIKQSNKLMASLKIEIQRKKEQRKQKLDKILSQKVKHVPYYGKVKCKLQDLQDHMRRIDQVRAKRRQEEAQRRHWASRQRSEDSTSVNIQKSMVMQILEKEERQQKIKQLKAKEEFNLRLQRKQRYANLIRQTFLDPDNKYVPQPAAPIKHPPLQLPKPKPTLQQILNKGKSTKLLKKGSFNFQLSKSGSDYQQKVYLNSSFDARQKPPAFSFHDNKSLDSPTRVSNYLSVFKSSKYNYHSNNEDNNQNMMMDEVNEENNVLEEDPEIIELNNRKKEIERRLAGYMI